MVKFYKLNPLDTARRKPTDLKNNKIVFFNTIFIVFVFLFLGTSAKAEDILEPVDVVVEQLATSTSRNISVTLGAGVEQSFKTIANQKKISGFSLALGDVDFYGAFYCRLKTTGLGGTVIATSTVSVSPIDKYKWLRCYFNDDINVTENTTYSFDFRTMNIEALIDPGVNVEIKTATNPYSLGEYRHYTNWTSFTLYSNDDLAFKVWGQISTTTPTCQISTTSVSIVSGLDIGKIYINGTTTTGNVSQVIEAPFLLFSFFCIMLLFIFWLFFQIKEQYKK